MTLSLNSNRTIIEPTQEYLQRLDDPEVLRQLHNISIADDHKRFLPYCQKDPNFLGRVVEMIPTDKNVNEIL